VRRVVAVRALARREEACQEALAEALDAFGDAPIFDHVDAAAQHSVFPYRVHLAHGLHRRERRYTDCTGRRGAVNARNGDATGAFHEHMLKNGPPLCKFINSSLTLNR